jgi:hypothetical protein
MAPNEHEIDSTLRKVLADLGLDETMRFEEITLQSAWSPLNEGCPCYWMNIDGVDPGGLGICRIEVRKDGLFDLFTDQYIASYRKLEGAIMLAEKDIVPLYENDQSRAIRSTIGK